MKYLDADQFSGPDSDETDYESPEEDPQTFQDDVILKLRSNYWDYCSGIATVPIRSESFLFSIERMILARHPRLQHAL